MKGSSGQYTKTALPLIEEGDIFKIIIQYEDIDKQSLGQDLNKKTLYVNIIQKLKTQPLSRKEIASLFGQSKVSGHLNRTLSTLLTDQLIELTIENVPHHPSQKFKITEKGKMFIKLLNEQ
ncbi:MAG: hypothetical protein GZ091_15535 [Paludibacter sp.]|nr:hypothetical protein [Paludibacter sp.]